MGQRHVFLSSLLILLLGFFSTHESITGQVIREQHPAYDLTGDGIVDTADLRDVMELASYGVYHNQADLNKDGVVDQQDVDLLTSFLSP